MYNAVLNVVRTRLVTCLVSYGECINSETNSIEVIDNNKAAHISNATSTNLSDFLCSTASTSSPSVTTEQLPSTPLPMKCDKLSPSEWSRKDINKDRRVIPRSIICNILRAMLALLINILNARNLKYKTYVFRFHLETFMREARKIVNLLQLLLEVGTHNKQLFAL